MMHQGYPAYPGYPPYGPPHPGIYGPSGYPTIDPHYPLPPHHPHYPPDGYRAYPVGSQHSPDSPSASVDADYPGYAQGESWNNGYRSNLPAPMVSGNLSRPSSAADSLAPTDVKAAASQRAIDSSKEAYTGPTSLHDDLARIPGKGNTRGVDPTHQSPFSSSSKPRPRISSVNAENVQSAMSYLATRGTGPSHPFRSASPSAIADNGLSSLVRAAAYDTKMASLPDAPTPLTSRPASRNEQREGGWTASRASSKAPPENATDPFTHARHYSRSPLPSIRDETSGQSLHDGGLALPPLRHASISSTTMGLNLGRSETISTSSRHASPSSFGTSSMGAVPFQRSRSGSTGASGNGHGPALPRLSDALAGLPPLGPTSQPMVRSVSKPYISPPSPAQQHRPEGAASAFLENDAATSLRIDQDTCAKPTVRRRPSVESDLSEPESKGPRMTLDSGLPSPSLLRSPPLVRTRRSTGASLGDRSRVAKSDYAAAEGASCSRGPFDDDAPTSARGLGSTVSSSRELRERGPVSYSPPGARTGSKGGPASPGRSRGRIGSTVSLRSPKYARRRSGGENQVPVAAANDDGSDQEDEKRGKCLHAYLTRVGDER